MKKGKKFYVEGRLSKRDYTDKEGVKRYVTEVISEKIINLESRDGARVDNDAYTQSANNDAAANTGEDDDLPF